MSSLDKDSGSEPQNTSGQKISEAYMVLARKYRPENFEDLIGQESMVQTLRNAFAAQRIAQAYMLTGVRGVGKTTTARILARALNYQTDTENSPSTALESYGIHCRDILLSQHVDVQEIDAASHTGIDNIRELIESTRYRPVSARYKVYIIDEVHMLSTAAFNGLLKTLEEPPAHVKFIFATTEIRKVPVTVLSRCQRFDLRRIPPEKLIDHFAKIAGLEGFSLSRQALALIARAAEGSVRDGLSILDQVIARGAHQDEKEIEADQVRAMLGLADRSQVLDLLEQLLAGETRAAVARLDALYEEGAEPRRILADLAELTSHMTRCKVTGTLEDPALGTQEVEKLRELAGKMHLTALSRAWQMLVKGLDEIKMAPDQLSAAMMILVRLAHASALPDPGELVRALEQVRSHSGGQEGSPSRGGKGSSEDGSVAELQKQGAGVAVSAQTQSAAFIKILSFEELSQACRLKREMMLLMSVEEHIRPVSFEVGKIVLQLTDDAPHGLSGDLRRKLEEWTGQPWQIMIVREGGGETLGEVKSRKQQAELESVKAHPLVKAVLARFEDAQITNVRSCNEKEAEKPLEGKTGSSGKIIRKSG